MESLPISGKADSLRTQIYQDLRRRLQRGEFGPGDRLVDVAIAEAMGVSRMPAREALLQLMNEGYLVATTRGFTLPALTPSDIADIFEVRKLLEPRAAANAARDLAPDAEARLAEALDAARGAVTQGDAVELALANVAFRQTWLGAVRNKRLAATISRFADHVQVVRFGTLHHKATQPIVLGGLEGLLDAFTRRDSVAALDRMTAFIVEAEKSFYAVQRAQDAAAGSEPSRRRSGRAASEE